PALHSFPTRRSSDLNRTALFGWYGAYLLGSRKVRWNRQGHLTGGGPLGAARQRRDEAHAAHAAQIVPHGRMEDAALAVIDGPDRSEEHTSELQSPYD